jgi:hypothetical protein
VYNASFQVTYRFSHKDSQRCSELFGHSPWLGCQVSDPTRKQHNPIITSQLLANWSSPDLKSDTPREDPGKKAISTSDFMGTRPESLPRCPILECTLSLSHTSFISLDCVNKAWKIHIEDKDTFMQTLCKRECEGRLASTPWHPLMRLILRLMRMMTSFAVVSCLAVRRTA